MRSLERELSFGKQLNKIGEVDKTKRQQSTPAFLTLAPGPLRGIANMGPTICCLWFQVAPATRSQVGPQLLAKHRIWLTNVGRETMVSKLI
jgi:hypothetical protein